MRVLTPSRERHSEQAARYGTHRYLDKPFDLDAMLTHIRDMIGVGLIDATWLAKLPPVLAERLQALDGALAWADGEITRVETEFGRVAGTLERRLTSNGRAGAGS